MDTQPLERMAVGGRELEFLRIPATRSERPVLVFLHEGLGSAGLWRDFPARLAARTGCGALVYSRYGNGFSSVLDGPRAPGYMHDEAFDSLQTILDVANVKSAVLFGHSDGGSIALLYAARGAPGVLALILEAPHVFVEELSVRSIAEMRAEYESTALREKMARHHRDADRTFYGWNDVWLSPEFRAWNIEFAVAQLRAPALVIQGTLDKYGTLAQVDAIAAGAPAAVDRLVLSGCGHAPHRERPALVEAACAAWLQERLAA